MKANDGKMRMTDVADIEQLFRIIQSIPSPKAEPLTDEWRCAGVKEGVQYASLTDIITQQWSGFTTKEYKQYKGLKKENLRDSITNLEIALNMLAEATTTEISQQKNPKGSMGSADAAKRGGKAARGARASIEKELGYSVVSSLNAKHLAARKSTGELTERTEKENK